MSNKKNIHPDVYSANVVCGGCGNTFNVMSTVEDIHISVCSNCHPYITGKQKLVDSAGRVERFNKKYAKFNKEQEDKAKAAS